MSAHKAMPVPQHLQPDVLDNVAYREENNNINDQPINGQDNNINNVPDNGHGNLIGDGVPFDTLTARQKDILSSPDQLDDIAAMFETKKHMRIVNWNSGTYNDARSALKDFRAERDAMRRYIEEHRMDADFAEGFERHKQQLEQKEETLRTRLGAYVRKVTKGGALSAGNKTVADMTQDAGAARLTGATHLIDYLAGEDASKTFMGSLVSSENGANYQPEQAEGGQVFTPQEIEIIIRQAAIERKSHPGQGYGRPVDLPDEIKRELLRHNREAQNAEHIHETDYAGLYKRIYKDLKQSGSSNAHRRAATQARQEHEAARNNNQDQNGLNQNGHQQGMGGQ
jgi:hypothetical protein